MAWNGSIDGNWDNVDFTKAPWVAGIAELTHDEVLFVITTCAEVAVGHENDDFYIQSRYNEYTNYEKAINGETYFCIKGYNPEIHTFGIDANGIVLEAPESPIEEQEEIVEVVEAPSEEV